MNYYSKMRRDNYAHCIVVIFNAFHSFSGFLSNDIDLQFKIKLSGKKKLFC